MNLKELFEKDYTRKIETVIKADDSTHILQEVEEYVVTNEISIKVADFFDQYCNYEGANGVWISGFFGSGKSHLLKILSYVLENSTINGTVLGELFASKVTDDPKLEGDIKAACRISSESILFNIDQQAQITSKTDANAILQVFYKVFYDHQGFYGFQPHIAEFERWLAGQELYEIFKEKFEAKSSKPWVNARQDYVDPAVEDAIADVCAELFSSDAEKYIDILDKFEDKTKFSIEDFANKVKSYIDTKPAGFRLNFFVDEVGQFVAENTKLMLNLQTIAESLATKCKGQSWILVTSQEDLENLIGDDSSIQSDDFSRIQARFSIRISLTSANVDEVIEKRLLAKNNEGQKLLTSLYSKEKENLSTLLSFSDVGVQFTRNYADEEDFIAKYPFVSYQFDLFQQCIKALSRHNAFTGRHASVGERSMLGVFQEVLKGLQNYDKRRLVSYDRLFEGLRSTMRTEVQNSIILAERNLSDNPLAQSILKALFLVKYFDSFKTTLRNISVLLIDDLDVNPNKHEKKIEVALNLLEQQNYIQRQGDTYEFLTVVEKDIQEEIKSTDIDSSQVTALFSDLLFDGIIKDTRIPFTETKQYFEFTRKVDGVLYGREKELTIELVTPNFDRYDDQNYYQGLSMGNQTHMLIKLASNDRIVRDARLYIQTNKFIKQKQSTSNVDEVKRILFEQGQQNQERKRELQTTLDDLLAGGIIYLNGSEHKVSSTGDGKTKVVYAFQDLIKLAYSKLRLLGNTTFDEARLKSIMKGSHDDLFGGEGASLTQPENDMLMHIQRRKKQNDRTTLTDIKEQFSKKPYGWGELAIWSIAAMLFKRGKIEGRQDTNVLEDADFEAALMNNRQHANTLIVPQVEFDQSQIRTLKTVHQELFNESNPHTEAKEVAAYFKEKLDQELDLINQYVAQKESYPFMKNLMPLTERLIRLKKMDYAALITSIKQVEDEILDDKEELLDPIKQFMNGEQKQIYDRVRKFENYNQANLSYIDAHEKEVVDGVRSEPHPYRGSAMKNAKEAMDTIEQRVKDAVVQEREDTVQHIDSKILALEEKPEFANLSETQQARVLEPLKKLMADVKTERFIGNLKERQARLNHIYADQLNLMIELATPEEESEPKRQFINQSKLKISFKKRELETEADVEEYLDSVREAMLKHIQKNRNILLE